MVLLLEKNTTDHINRFDHLTPVQFMRTARLTFYGGTVYRDNLER